MSIFYTRSRTTTNSENYEDGDKTSSPKHERRKNITCGKQNESLDIGNTVSHDQPGPEQNSA